MSLDLITQRQLDLGAAGWFRPEAEVPAGNQVRVKAGFAFVGGLAVRDQNTGGDQLTAGFASVSGAGFKRYDLVWIDANGAVQITQGTEVALAAAAFQGAPGFTGGPDLPDQAVPVAYVLIDEVTPATPIIDGADITQINGIVYISRTFDGYYIDKGLLGGAPAGNSDDVTALFNTETPGGGTSARGIITAAPLNFVFIVDQIGNELLTTADGSQVYGRVTEAAGTWTLTYFALDNTGTEIAVDVSTDITTAPTNLRLIGVPKVFSRNDPTRPLFNSSVQRLSDLAAADIPTATTTVQGKALAGTASPAIPLIGTVNEASDLGGVVAGGPWHRLFFNAPGGSVLDAGGGVLQINAAGTPGPTGPAGPAGGAGPTGPAGPAGAGFTQFNSGFRDRSVLGAPGLAAFVENIGVGFNWVHAGAGANHITSATGFSGLGINTLTGRLTATLSINGQQEPGLVPGQVVRLNWSVSG